MGSGVDAINVYSGKPKNGQSWTCYAVRIGRKRGIFMDHADAEAQMSGYSDGKLRGVLTLGDAEGALCALREDASAQQRRRRRRRRRRQDKTRVYSLLMQAAIGRL